MHSGPKSLFLKVEFDRDGAVVEGSAIRRPSRVSPSQWLKAWELFRLWNLDRTMPYEVTRQLEKMKRVHLHGAAEAAD